MASFQYKNSGVWTDVPDYAHPDDEGGSIAVEWPAPTARDGNGLPCGALGLPRIVIKFDRMLGTGMAWWNAFFSTATDLSVTITGLSAYEPRAASWKKYTGTLIRPVYGQVQPAATAGRTWYLNGEIVVDAITETS